MTQWTTLQDLSPYPETLTAMERQVEAIRHAGAEDAVWLLEHPPLYTAGASAKAADLLDARFPVHPAGRGGEYTYHGPGQRVAYVMMDLKRLFAPSPPDLRAYVRRLETWIIDALQEIGVEAFTRAGRVGVWVADDRGRMTDDGKTSVSLSSVIRPPSTESKIAAIGVRVRAWVAYHGIALNVHPDLSHYDGIVPCGIREHGMTSLQALGMKVSMQEVDAHLRDAFTRCVECRLKR